MLREIRRTPLDMPDKTALNTTSAIRALSMILYLYYII